MNVAYLMNVGQDYNALGTSQQRLLVHETTHVWQGKNSTLALTYVLHALCFAPRTSRRPRGARGCRHAFRPGFAPPRHRRRRATGEDRSTDAPPLRQAQKEAEPVNRGARRTVHAELVLNDRASSESLDRWSDVSSGSLGSQERQGPQPATTRARAERSLPARLAHPPLRHHLEQAVAERGRVRRRIRHGRHRH